MAAKPNLHDFFTFGEKLGAGSFASVTLVTENATGKKYAMKIIEKAKSKGMEAQIVKEITILKKIKHPNIVRLHECFETREKIYLQMEYVSGGELFDRIVNMGYYGENDAKIIVSGILEAVQYLHQLGIVHRDLKPENLLMSSADENAIVKLSDFGLSTMMTEDSMLKTACGTLMYCAPEVLKGQTYGKAVDLWSIGVITYVLLCGYPPFWDQDDNITLQLVIRGTFEFPSPEWDGFSNVAKEFIRGLICIDPVKRLDCEKALNHAWLSLDVKGERKNIVGHVGTNLTKHFTGKKSATIMKRVTVQKGQIKDVTELPAPGQEAN